MTEPKRPAADALREAAQQLSEQRYTLVLYIAGTTPFSAEALANVVALCDEQLAGRADLRVVDVYQQPEQARDDQILAVPTLLKKSPLPARRLIGDLSDRARVMAGLGLRREAGHEAK